MFIAVDRRPAAPLQSTRGHSPLVAGADAVAVDRVSTAASSAVIAALLLAALTTGIPEPGSPVPAIAWGTAALAAAAGGVLFGLSGTGRSVAGKPKNRAVSPDGPRPYRP